MYITLSYYSFYYHLFFFFFSSRRRHTRLTCDWSSDVCSSDLDVTSLLQGQKDLSTQMTQDHTVIKTIVGGFNDNISHLDRKSTRLNSSHMSISYAVFCLKKKNKFNDMVKITGNYTDDKGKVTH